MKDKTDLVRYLLFVWAITHFAYFIVYIFTENDRWFSRFCTAVGCLIGWGVITELSEINKKLNK